MHPRMDGLISRAEDGGRRAQGGGGEMLGKNKDGHLQASEG